MPDDRPLTRRRVLTSAGAAAGMVALTACSSGSDSSASPSTGSGEPSTTSASQSPSGSGETALAQLADIPVGGAVAAQLPGGDPVVVAQPEQGEAAAFSAICTHMGCTVAPAGKELHCPCHGSVFDASTGQVLQGPAARPLPSVQVEVRDGAVVPA